MFRHSQPRGQGRLNHLTDGVDIVIGHPAKKGNHGFGKERRLVQHIADEFNRNISGQLPGLSQDIAGYLPAAEGHQHPHTGDDPLE